MDTFNADAYQYSGKTLAGVLEDLENNDNSLKSTFSGASSPSDPVAGQLWYDTTNNILKVYYSGSWRSIYNASTQAYVGSVGTSNLVDSSVTTAKINALAVTEAKIGAGAVTAAKLGSGAAASNLGAGSVSNTHLASNSVTVAKINDSEITAAKMSTGLTTQVVDVRDADGDYKVTLTFTNGLLTAYSRTYTAGP